MAPARASRDDGWIAGRDVEEAIVWPSVSVGPAKVLKSEEGEGQEAIKRGVLLRQEKAARNNEGSWGNCMRSGKVPGWAELRFGWIDEWS